MKKWLFRSKSDGKWEIIDGGNIIIWMNGYLLKKSIYGEFMGFDQRKFAGFLWCFMRVGVRIAVKMLPIVRKLENNKHLNLQCFDIDDPANRRLVDYYQVQAVPLWWIYKAGEQLWRWNGEIEEEELMQTLKRLLK